MLLSFQIDGSETKSSAADFVLSNSRFLSKNGRKFFAHGPSLVVL